MASILSRKGDFCPEGMVKLRRLDMLRILAILAKAARRFAVYVELRDMAARAARFDSDWQKSGLGLCGAARDGSAHHALPMLASMEMERAVEGTPGDVDVDLPHPTLAFCSSSEQYHAFILVYSPFLRIRLLLFVDPRPRLLELSGGPRPRERIGGRRFGTAPAPWLALAPS